jgi:hypothetical protein
MCPSYENGGSNALQSDSNAVLVVSVENLLSGALGYHRVVASKSYHVVQGSGSRKSILRGKENVEGKKRKNKNTYIYEKKREKIRKIN